MSNKIEQELEKLEKVDIVKEESASKPTTTEVVEETQVTNPTEPVETTAKIMDLDQLFLESQSSSIKSPHFDDLKDLFSYLDKSKLSMTPSQSFELLYKDYYSNPKFKKSFYVRMLDISEDKIILSLDDAQDRFKKAILLSIVDEDNRPLSKAELDELYVSEIEYLYLRYRVHNLSQYHNLQYRCSCGKLNNLKVDLTELKITKPSSVESIRRKLVLPLSKLEVVIEIPRVKDQERIKRFIDNLESTYSKSLNSLERVIETTLTEKALSIRMIGGIPIEDEIETVRILLEKLPTNDLTILNKYYESFSEVGVDFTTEGVCPTCNTVNRIEIPYSWELFRPAL